MIGNLCAMALLGGIGSIPAPDDQAFLAILAETKVGRIAGMEMPDLSELPPGFKLPPEAMMFAGKAARILNVRLWSQGIAPQDAKATLVPPPGLKQGDQLNLDLFRPTGTSSGPARDFDPDSTPDFTMKIYWGSSETVKEGQPKIIRWGDLTDEQKEAMKQKARESRPGNSYFYRPNWTTGFWPTPKQPGQIDAMASLVGKYSLTTTYTGNVEIEAPDNVNFLAPIEFSAPNLSKKIDLKKSINFEWKLIPNVLGQYATIMGMEGKSTLVLWTSSEVFANELMGDMGFMQMADVRDRVVKTMFMAPDRTKVSVPAGIFQNADTVMMNMAGYGPGAALEKAQPLPRIQTKTSINIILGGKKVDF
jgi:hypothetical protein